MVKITSLPVLTKPKMMFDVWYTGQDYSHFYNFTTPVTKDISLYAKWISQQTAHDHVQAILEFTLIDGDGYSVKKKEDATITGALTIPAVWNDISVTTIAANGFYHCAGLTNIRLPDSLTSIEKAVFAACTSLTSITLPLSIKLIESHAFYSCFNLTSVTIRNETPPSLGKEAFTDCSENLKIKVSKQAVSAYTTAFSWTEYANKISAFD